MIGGGEWTHRDLNYPIDEELFVRMAQCSAFFPMMQFSWAPWEAVSKEALLHVKAAHDLHVEFSETIIALVNDAYETGEPIIRSLAYNYPEENYEYVNDQFMLGESILVAPVIQKGQTVKEVHLPKGKWQTRNGEIYEGGRVLSYPVDISSIPCFFKI
jgi:alpha-glucosidase (family GH31 glycosyl hydrolase)